MEKQKDYSRCHFPAGTLTASIDALRTAIGRSQDSVERFYTLSVKSDGAEWSFDTVEEFLADYRKPHQSSFFSFEIRYKDGNDKDADASASLKVQYFSIGLEVHRTTVYVGAENRNQIETVFEVFERDLDKALIPEVLKPTPRPTIFIGHGRSAAWRDLKDHLQDQHGYEVEAYETGARAGHAIRDILDEMASNSSFALLVMTGEDFLDSRKQRARQNVVHETGLFQGRLGFNRAVVLLENGVEEFSNLQGIQQIRFDTGHIRSTFGDVLATLRREFDQ